MEENNISDKEMLMLKLGNSFTDLLSIIDDNVDEGKDTAALFMLDQIDRPFNNIVTDLCKRGFLTTGEMAMIKTYVSRIVSNEKKIIHNKEKIRLLESDEAIRSFNKELQEVQDMYKHMKRNTI